jgi:hypothetical protein
MSAQATRTDPTPDGPCTHKEGCSLFPLLKLRTSLQYWIASYCDSSEYSRCARYQSMKAGRPPPPTMLPNGRTVGSIDK